MFIKTPVVKHDIRLYPDVLDEEFCEKLISEFKAGESMGEVIEGYVSSDDVDNYRSDKYLVSKDVHLYEHERWDEMNIALHKNYVLPVLKMYLKNYGNVLEHECEVDVKNCILSEYEQGVGMFAPHQDAVGGLQKQRSLTIIVYLNTVMKGGETEFFNQSYSVAPRAGSVLVFPSNFVYSHRGNVPVSDSKFITVSFASVGVGENIDVDTGSVKIDSVDANSVKVDAGIEDVSSKRES